MKVIVKKKSIFIFLGMIILSCTQLLIFCAENDLVNYVVGASEQRFSKGVAIWQAPYKNLPSFQSDESRLWSENKLLAVCLLKQLDETVIEDEKADTINVLTELVSPSSVDQHACAMSIEKNHGVDVFSDSDDDSQEDDEVVASDVTSNKQKTLGVSNKKLKRLRYKNKIKAARQQQLLDDEILNQAIAQAKQVRDQEAVKQRMLVGSIKKVNKNSPRDMMKDLLTIESSFFLMTEDMKNNEQSGFWFKDGTPKMYKILSEYIFDGGIVTSRMHTLLYDFRKETLTIKVRLRDHKEDAHYLFADKNDRYALVMKAMMDKENPYKICELLEQCNPSEDVMEMKRLVMNSGPVLELNPAEEKLLLKDDFFKKFMHEYKDVMIEDGLVDCYTQVEFRSKALPILRNLAVDNPEPYLQALHKIRGQADIIQALFTK